jgi:hypothetical protein
MRQDPTPNENGWGDLLLAIPAGALMVGGIALPEYWVIFAASAFAAMLLLAVIQKIGGHDDPRRTKRPPDAP